MDLAGDARVNTPASQPLGLSSAASTHAWISFSSNRLSSA